MSKRSSIFLESHHLKNQFFGFGQFNYHLIKALQKQNLNDLDITLHAADPSRWKKEFGATFNIKKYRTLSRYPLARIRKKYDLWHAMNQNTKIEPYHDIPYILTVHNITYIKDPSNYMHEEVHRRFQDKLTRSSAITYISKYAQDSTHQFFKVPAVPEFVIHNGNPISYDVLSKSHQPEQFLKGPFLFSIGEFTARKNFISLVHMLEFLPDMNLVIAGKNSTREAQEIIELINKKNLSHRILLPGKVSEEDKQWFYKNCEAFVFPSLREGFGLPIIEAMQFGKPVFTSHNTSLPEVGSDVAIYWHDYDPKYMATTLLSGLGTIQQDLKSYQKKAIIRANSFNWDIAATQYLEVYKTVLKQ